MRSYKYILGLIPFFSLASAKAQDLSRVDQVLGGYPANFSSTEELALKITRDFSTDLEKVRAVYTWIALHVAYDTKALGKSQKVRFSYRSQAELEARKKQFHEDLVLKTLKRCKALCEGYSTLFQDLCRHMNIKCEIISGTTRRVISEIGREDLPSNHAWNAVKINGSWSVK